MGPGTLFTKLDVKTAFCLLPAQRHLVVMCWNNHIYVDICFPFGLRSTPKIFNILADPLSWIQRVLVLKVGMACIDRYQWQRTWLETNWRILL